MKTVFEAFLELKPREHDMDAVGIMTDLQTRTKVTQAIINYPSFALPSPDNAVMICGVVTKDDIGEAWMVAGVGFEQQMRTVLRQMRVGLRDICRLLELRQLLILVDPQRKGAAKYVKRLGFVAGAEPRIFQVGDKAVEMYFFNINQGA